MDFPLELHRDGGGRLRFKSRAIRSRLVIEKCWRNDAERLDHDGARIRSILALRTSAHLPPLMAGANPAAVQRILRDPDPKITTQVYGHHGKRPGPREGNSSEI